MNISTEITPEVQMVLDWAKQYKCCAVDDVPKDLVQTLRFIFGHTLTLTLPTSIRFLNGEYGGCLIHGRYADRPSIREQFHIEAVIRYKELIDDVLNDADICPVDLEEVL